MSLTIAIRYILTALLFYGVYLETGPMTTLAFFLAGVSLEISAYNWEGHRRWLDYHSKFVEIVRDKLQIELEDEQN